jgi:hypothetical protein
MGGDHHCGPARKFGQRAKAAGKGYRFGVVVGVLAGKKRLPSVANDEGERSVFFNIVDKRASCKKSDESDRVKLWYL